MEGTPQKREGGDGPSATGSLPPTSAAGPDCTASRRLRQAGCGAESEQDRPRASTVAPASAVLSKSSAGTRRVLRHDGTAARARSRRDSPLETLSSGGGVEAD